MKRTITALAIIVLGIAIFLGNTNTFGLQGLLGTWWPLGLILVAGLVLMNNPRNYVWPVFLGGVGLVVLLNNLKLTSISVGDIIFPAIVVAFGLSMLLNSSSSRRTTHQSDEEISAFMSGSSMKNNSKDYTGARVTSVMGGVEMDISHAVIKNEATINVFVMMGGIELRVPEHVIVKNRASMILGGIEDKTRPSEAKNSPVLYIDGSVVMGGIEIKR